MSKLSKFYVVWVGRKSGVYSSWAMCKEQVFGFEGAKYKSYLTKSDAEAAFKNSYNNEIGKAKKDNFLIQNNLKKSSPELHSICVDGAWNTATGDIEYQGIYLKSKTKIFHAGPYKDGSNNIAEFLAIVHALAFCKQQKSDIPIYSDSISAMSWIRKKKANTTVQLTTKNKPLLEMLKNAELWLIRNDYTNKILKWETKSWGENPADFGRK